MTSTVWTIDFVREYLNHVDPSTIEWKGSGRHLKQTYTDCRDYNIDTARGFVRRYRSKEQVTQSDVKLLRACMGWIRKNCGFLYEWGAEDLKFAPPTPHNKDLRTPIDEVKQSFVLLAGGDLAAAALAALGIGGRYMANAVRTGKVIRFTDNVRSDVYLSDDEAAWLDGLGLADDSTIWQAMRDRFIGKCSTERSARNSLEFAKVGRKVVGKSLEEIKQCYMKSTLDALGNTAEAEALLAERVAVQPLAIRENMKRWESKGYL